MYYKCNNIFWICYTKITDIFVEKSKRYTIFV